MVARVHPSKKTKPFLDPGVIRSTGILRLSSGRINFGEGSGAIHTRWRRDDDRHRHCRCRHCRRRACHPAVTVASSNTKAIVGDVLLDVVAVLSTVDARSPGNMDADLDAASRLDSSKARYWSLRPFRSLRRSYYTGRLTAERIGQRIRQRPIIGRFQPLHRRGPNVTIRDLRLTATRFNCPLPGHVTGRGSRAPFYARYVCSSKGE